MGVRTRLKVQASDVVGADGFFLGFVVNQPQSKYSGTKKELH